MSTIMMSHAYEPSGIEDECYACGGFASDHEQPPDPRDARIAQLEAALRELASAVIEHQEDDLPSTRQRVRNAIADGMHALNPSIEGER